MDEAVRQEGLKLLPNSEGIGKPGRSLQMNTDSGDDIANATWINRE